MAEKKTGDNPKTGKPWEYLEVPVVKAKAEDGTVVNIAICLDDVPDEVYKEALYQGFKTIMNRGMSKITTSTTKNKTELRTLAMEAAETNLENIYEGKVRITGGKAKKAKGAINTEAMRLARNVVKDEIKRAGGKISHYDASEITKAARALVEADPSFVEQAEKNLAERAKVVEAVASKIDLSKIAVSAKKVAAAAAKKKEGTLSAKQAGMLQMKSKPATHATH